MGQFENKSSLIHPEAHLTDASRVPQQTSRTFHWPITQLEIDCLLSDMREGDQTSVTLGLRNLRSCLGAAPAMRNLLHSASLLVLDLASTFLFLVVYLLTHNIPLAVALGMGLGIAQIGVQFARRRPIETMEWLSLFLVVASGTAALITDNPRFVLFKPSVLYTIVGVVMLKRGWINRYLPPLANAVVADVAVVVGLLWAGLMFVSAAVNAFVAASYDVMTWAWFMPVFGIVSKIILFLISFAMMRFIGRRRLRAMPESERQRLTAAVA